MFRIANNRTKKSRARRTAGRMWSDSRGSVFTAFAIVLPTLLLTAAVAVDYAFLSYQHQRLQKVAELAAISSAREFVLSNRDPSQVEAVAKTYVGANADATSPKTPTAPITVRVDVPDDGTVKVQLSQPWTPFFAHLVDSSVNPIVASATARVVGSGAVCVIGLMDYSIFASIHLDNKAKLLAEGCGAYSNSKSKYSIRLDGASSISAETICAAGGVLALGQISAKPKPITDCPQIEDPLAGRPAPHVGACAKSDLVIDGTGPVSLSPGVYCDGLTIGGSVDVTLQPGTYVIKDGIFKVTDTAKLSGTDVGFYLTGAGSTFEFDEGTVIDLSAPRKTDMAGLLFYEDPSVPHSFKINALLPQMQPKDVRVHRIRSNDARRLLGTIYLPKSILMVDSKAPVADNSAFTAIVVARLWLREGPTLVINSDYGATEVPLPSSLAGGEITLVK